MGTPGDKIKGKVVEDEHLDPPEQTTEDTPSVNLPAAQAIEEMGFLSAPPPHLQPLTNRFGRKDHLGRHIKKSHSKNLPPEDLDTSSESTSVKVETIVKSELTTPEFEMPQETTEEMFIGGPEIIPFSLGEGTSSMMKYEPKFEDVAATEPQFPQAALTTDILGYCLENVQEFVPPSYIDPFLEENVKDDFSLILSSPSQSELIQIFDMQSSASSSTVPETTVSDNSGLLTETEVLSNPEIQRLLQPSEEANLPLPGFSQTFQSPPPPHPPQPPP
ncbi:uncharacterized protein LOC123307304 isoform X2 [Coccinella septempunctata]|uniref:uncharacterized protein LOC123307304 isoform X2 n=1 Tax=Coccinella septempunctata TaxID=41139 RepID=UPI001D07CEB4|nr:uncharacterized protein LOC123307304 isoform X2 [Coccinella septempunctata]